MEVGTTNYPGGQSGHVIGKLDMTKVKLERSIFIDVPKDVIKLT
jgi:hypothetical protein